MNERFNHLLTVPVKRGHLYRLVVRFAGSAQKQLTVVQGQTADITFFQDNLFPFQAPDVPGGLFWDRVRVVLGDDQVEMLGQLQASLATHNAVLVAHDTNISTRLMTHDTDIKQALAMLQEGIDEANRKLAVSLAVQRELVKQTLTPEGRRASSSGLLSCDAAGMPCPDVLPCPDGDCVFDFPLKEK